MVEGIYLDFGGTLVTFKKPWADIFVEILAKDGILESVGGEDRVRKVTQSHIKKMGSGFTEHGRPDFYSDIFQDLDDPESAINLIREKEIDHISLTHSNVYSILAPYADKGKHLAVITNASNNDMPARFVQHYNLQDLLEVYGASGEWICKDNLLVRGDIWPSALKDEGMLYTILLAHRKIKQDSLMIGDDVIRDGVMAKKAGLTPLIYANGRPKKKDLIEAEANKKWIPLIQSFEEIKRYVR